MHFARLVLNEALVQLIAEGIVCAASPHEGSVSVAAHWENMTGGISVPTGRRDPWFGGGSGWWRLVRPEESHELLITENEMLEGLQELLDSRGMATLRESLRAYRAGLYRASGTLLAAASEAAWFALAREVLTAGSAKHALAMTGEQTADIIHATDQAFAAQNLATRAVRRDLSSKAAHLRDIRNYGLHPAGAHDVDRELSLAQAAVATLMLSTRRYFVELAGILEQARSKKALDAPSTSPSSAVSNS